MVSRPGKGRNPWYLLTSEPVATNDDAWRVLLVSRAATKWTTGAEEWWTTCMVAVG